MKLRGSPSQIEYPCWAEIKMDGEYTWLVKTDASCYTVNKYGLCRLNYPITESAKRLKGASLGDFILIGELYYGDGKKGRLYDLLSHKESDALNFMPFDIVQFKGVSVGKATLVDRLEMMHELGVDPTIQNHGRVIDDKEQLNEYCEWVKEQGYEGIVVKGLEGVLIFGPCNWIKLKYKDQSDFRVTLIDPVKERIEVVVYTPTTLRQVGCKCSNKDKATLKVGDTVTIEHQGILAQGGLRHPVFKGKV